MEVTLFWDVTLTSLEDNYWCFRILLPSASEYNAGNCLPEGTVSNATALLRLIKLSKNKLRIVGKRYLSETLLFSPTNILWLLRELP